MGAPHMPLLRFIQAVAATSPALLPDKAHGVEKEERSGNSLQHLPGGR